MTESPSPREMPQPAVGALLRAVGIGLAATAATLAAILALVDRPDWWRGYFAAATASVLAAAISLVPLVWGLRRGMHQMLAGYFLAAGLRAVVSLAACVLAIVAGHYPAVPTLLLMMAFYFVLLAVEAIFLGKALWSARQ